MQLTRSLWLAFCAAGIICNQIWLAPSWTTEWLLHTVYIVLLGIYAWTFAMYLGGNLISHKLDWDGLPELEGPSLKVLPFLLTIAFAALVVTITLSGNRQAIVDLDMLMAVPMLLRLILWNSFELDGHASYGTDVEPSKAG